MKTSYSQSSTYIKCSRYWFNKYKKKLDPIDSGASLAFGSAIDVAVGALLRGENTYLDLFNQKWYSTVDNGKPVQIFDNPHIIYAHSDFDEDVFDDIDKDLLKRWLTELKIDPDRLGVDGIGAYKEASKIKKNPFKQLRDNELQYFNRASWLSLRNKGKILLEAFKEQFIPKVKKVLAIQQNCYLKDELTQDGIQGVIDMVVEMQGYDKPLILDLKTAQRPYTDEQIDNTQQLALYLAMKGKDYNTNIVGYVVLCKHIEKEYSEYCSVCGKVKDSRALSCDGKDSKGKRCGGEWIEKVQLKPVVQILIREKSEAEVQEVLKDQSNVIFGMKEEIVYKNTDLCQNWYGSPCSYYHFCRNGDMTGLKERGKE